MQDVEWERHGPVMVVSLNRPAIRNAIGGSTLRLLLEAFREADADDAVRAVVTTGRGGTFSVGADVAALQSATTDSAIRPDRGGNDTGLPPMSASAQLTDPLGPGRWALEMLKLEKPSLAAVDGAAAGGGLCLALLHDFRVASPSAKFATGFVALGLAPEMGASYLLPRLVGMSTARRMLLLNERLSAQEALAAGLVDALALETDVLAYTVDLADRLGRQPPAAVRLTSRLLSSARERSLPEQMELEYTAQRQLFATADHREAVAAFRDRRTGTFTGR